MPLTAKAIVNAKPREKKYKLTDGKGMYLYVWPNGSKYWRLKYRFAGKESTLALGTYPAVSLQEARTKLFEAKQQLDKGINPNKQKQEQKRAQQANLENTFQAAAESYCETQSTNWSEKHRAKMWRRLELHVFPYFGATPINELRRAEVLEIAKRVEERAPYLAKRVLQLCKAIFTHAAFLERIEHNPAADLSKLLKPHKHTHHPALKASELPQFLKALDAAETNHRNKLMIKLLMLTFVRQQELRYAYWEDIHFDEAKWYVRAETMKMRQEHIVPLSKQAIKVLRAIQQYTGNHQYIFPSYTHGKAKVLSENTINMIIKRMGYGGKLVGHGFRTTASTTLNEQGNFAPDVIERQLAHAEQNEVRASYNRAEYLPQRIEMMQWWGDYLEQKGLNCD